MQPRFKVADEWATIRTIIEQRASICRYGDGELNLALGANAKAQFRDEGIAGRLREILKSDSPCLIGIPNIYDGVKAECPKAQHFWMSMAGRPQYDKLMDPAKQYYSSFITRPDNTSGINTAEYYDLVRSIWTGRKVVIVCGEGVRFCKHDAFLGNAETIFDIKGPAVNAWLEYGKILSRCMLFPKETLFLLRLGPAATVLAFDLCEAGYQALDLGHLGMFVNRFYNPKAPEIDYDNSKTGKDGRA